MGSKNIDSDNDSNAEEAVETKPIDKVSKELAGIRKRRNSDSKRRFPSAIEDWTLLAGLGYGALYAMLLFGMSGGVFGESTFSYDELQALLDMSRNGLAQLAEMQAAVLDDIV